MSDEKEGFEFYNLDSREVCMSEIKGISEMMTPDEIFEAGKAAAKKELKEKHLESLIAAKLELEAMPNKKYLINIISGLAAAIKWMEGK